MFESLYSYAQAATTTSPTAGAVSLIATYPSIEIPGGFFTALGKKSSSVKLKAGGQLTMTATVPTWLFGVAWTQATPAAFSASNVLAATAAFTPTAVPAGAWWLMELDVTLRSIGLGVASTLLSVGQVSCPEAFAPTAYAQASGAARPMPAVGVSGASGSVDVDQPLFLWPFVTLGAATAGNTVTTQYAKLYGEN